MCGISVPNWEVLDVRDPGQETSIAFKQGHQGTKKDTLEKGQILISDFDVGYYNGFTAFVMGARKCLEDALIYPDDESSKNLPLHLSTLRLLSEKWHHPRTNIASTDQLTLSPQLCCSTGTEVSPAPAQPPEYSIS